MNKKEFPLAVLEALQEWIDKKGPHFIKAKPSTEYLLKFIDSDKSSGFFFEIKSYTITSGNKHQFRIVYKPSSQNHNSPQETWAEHGHISTLFDSWQRYLSRYEKLRNPLSDEDDNILKQSEKEFYDEFELIDEDAATNSFHYNQQIFIDGYLDYIIKQLEEGKTEKNKAIVEEIINDAINLQENQAQFTKKLVVQKLSSILAKTKKAGIKFLKEIYSEAKKEVLKQIVKAAIDPVQIDYHIQQLLN